MSVTEFLAAIAIYDAFENRRAAKNWRETNEMIARIERQFDEQADEWMREFRDEFDDNVSDLEKEIDGSLAAAEAAGAATDDAGREAAWEAWAEESKIRLLSLSAAGQHWTVITTGAVERLPERAWTAADHFNRTAKLYYEGVEAIIEGDTARGVALCGEGLAVWRDFEALARSWAPSPAPGSLADRLSQLAEVRDAGLISPEEYEVRRRAMMDSL